MKLYIFVLLVITIMFSTSCDRFKHTFEPAVTQNPEEILFTPLQTAFDAITANDVSAVMVLYDDDYLHNSQQKADREAFFQSMFAKVSDPVFTVSLIASQTIGIDDTLSTTTWQLLVTDSAKQVIADSTFFGEEIIKRGNTWLLYGNRDTCCPPVTFKERIIVEKFTYTTCPNCPDVAEQLHQLQLAYPYSMSYLEYHVANQLNIGNGDVYGYYGNPSMPTVVFNGQSMIIGNNTDNEQIFNQLATQISNADAKISLINLDYVISEQALSGTIRLNVLDQNIDTSTLKLKYAIVDKESADYTYIPSGYPCRNVVIAKGTKSLLDADLSQAVNFSVPINNLPAVYGGNLPTDSALIIWVQVTPDPFNSNAKIYNALESPINVNK